MMKSPTSLIRFRNAVGVVLALSALFAVVISIISLTSDKATAQVADADDAVTKRAAAWFNSLTLDEAINAILGADADAVTDVPGEPATIGRQYVDADNPAVIDEPIEYIHDAWTTKSATQSFYDGLPADTTAAGDSGTANKAGVNLLVDGSTASPGDIYAVGEQMISGSNAIRGFQSVELWWNHLTCVEARTAVGEDNDELSNTDQDNDTAGFQAAASSVCRVILNDSDQFESIMRIAYDDLTDNAQANEVGKALLGSGVSEQSSSANNARAERWWDVLTATQRIQALYGEGVTAAGPTNADDTAVVAARPWIASQDYADITTALTFTDTIGNVETALPLDADSKALVDGVKALINDRNILVYGTMGPYSGDYEGVVAWWSAIGCLEMQIAVGADNEPGTETEGFCQPFATLADVQDRSAGEISDRERVTTVGRALLNLKSIPQVAAWWNKLSPDQMVYVVYGNPPERSADRDHDGDEEADPVPVDGVTPQIPFVTDADKAVFKTMYDGLTGSVPQTGHLTTEFVALLTRHGVSVSPVDVTDDDVANPEDRYLAKDIVHALANEVFDPPTKSGNDPLAPTAPITDGDLVFNPPYVSVGDWWGNLDCRVMRLAVGEDNDYLDPAVAAVPDGTPPILAEDQEASIYCGAYPGSGDMPVISAEAQKRVDEVGIALLGRSDRGRPTFNAEVTFNGRTVDVDDRPSLISGLAQVGALLTADPTGINDANGVPTDDDGKKVFSYQWLRNGDPIEGATGKTYTLQADDANATISVRVSFYDNARFHESVTGAATSTIAGSPGEISRIEPGIRGITVSGGDTVTLSVDIYGLQDAKDNGIGGNFTWDENGDEIDDESGRTLDYEASSSPGKYLITASLSGADCQPEVEADRATACSAEFDVTVRRPSADGPEQEAPANPPGEIPGILADSDGNQYEVFTPVEGGTFTGEGYSLTVDAGAVPNGEFLGIRMSDEGAASNLGMTHQRYTLGGNMYAISAVDSSQATISSYVLDDPALACVPLPDELRSNISDLALVAINSDGSLTILAAQVRITSSGNMVCGALSNLPASVAVGTSGAPEPIPPTPTPEPTAVPPPTGGTAPASSMVVLWSLLLGVAVFALGSVLVIARRREGARTR